MAAIEALTTLDRYPKTWYKQLWALTACVGAVVAVNIGFSHDEDLDWVWSLLVAGVQVLRDLPQRHWGPGVLALMLLSAGLSYRLVNLAVAVSSATAFPVGETVDWVIFPPNHRPFLGRVWSSVLASAPVDTAAFLHLAQILTRPLIVLGMISKMAVGFAIALALRRGAQRMPPRLR